jgi:flavin-dependent dehydrogenase
MRSGSDECEGHAPFVNMKPSAFDVAIVGGGPGGSATAISLLAHAPSLSVILIEASNYDTCRLGETLPPPARSILEHLDLWDVFCTLSPREVFGTTAIWGQSAPVDNDFIYMPANTGWHIDRTAFDRMLASEATNRGAVLRLGASLRDVQQDGDHWLLRLSHGAELLARFIVDATGGTAALARRFGAQFVSLDRFVGAARFFEDGRDDSRLLVEAFEHGWWYTAGLPNGKRITGCMTDADLAQRMKLGETEEWQRTLATAPAVAALMRECKPTSPIIIRSTASRRLDPAATERWLAVGDAASRFDPLSSQGIVKALRSGIFASYAIGDWLIRGDKSGLQRYCRYVDEEFRSYSEVRTKYYCQEQRWPASQFWRRRHNPVYGYTDYRSGF